MKLNDALQSVYENINYEKIETEMKDAIYKRADAINKVSENFQLSHTIFALEKLINKAQAAETTQNKEKEELIDLKRRMLSCINEEGQHEASALIEECKYFEDKHRRDKIHILLDYIDITDKKASRVIKSNNYYVICLPKCLLEDIKNEDNEYDYEKIRNLRELIAHELGHLAFHFNIFNENDKIDNLDKISEDQESEANFFRDIFLEMRRERNKMYVHM